MKRILAVIAMVALIVLVRYGVSAVRHAHDVTSTKIGIAASRYVAGLKAKGVPVPSAVSAKTLVDEQLLPSSAASGFKGIGMTVNLMADRSRPRDVLFRAESLNGTELVGFVDGTVETVRK